MTGREQLAAIRILASTNSTAYIARPDDDLEKALSNLLFCEI
ncbi:hypothetical protein [Nostoc sp.]